LNVKRLRKQAGVSQETFADTAHIARSYMSDIERGLRNPTLQVVARIAEALGVSPSSLLE
jgi:transcriptional regulator with XRE-family HTH domain